MQISLPSGESDDKPQFSICFDADVVGAWGLKEGVSYTARSPISVFLSIALLPRV